VGLVPAIAAGSPRIIAFAASTGGPNALAEVLAALPNEVDVPVVITQHMPPVFTRLLAERLARETHRHCVEAVTGMPINRGEVYVAPGDYHLVIREGASGATLRLSHAEAENHCRPAADVMLRSVAEAYGAGVLAVVLTGMGEDGRRGCEAVRAAGGRVIVQDEASSVVWGMPGAVANAGAANAIVPLGEIASAIATLCVPSLA
jgi:two-component system chemotaxis response regulator CheB